MLQPPTLNPKRRCLKAHVIIVDDDDAPSDEALLRTLATPLWDQPPAAVKEALTKMCKSPIGGPASGGKGGSWLAVFGGGAPGEGVAGGVAYEKSGCGVLRERFNDEVKAR